MGYPNTTYLDAHPEYSALLGRSGVDTRSLQDGEYGSLSVFSEGRLAWSSGEFDLFNLSRSSWSATFYHRDRKSFRFLLHYLRVHRGDTRRVTVSIDPPARKVDNLGRTRMEINGAEARYPSAVRTARRRALVGVTQTKTAQLYPISAPTRASPETISTPYLKVVESRQTNGTYSISVTPSLRTRFQRTWSGVRTPGFSKLKPSQYPVNPHSVTIVDVETDGPIIRAQWGIAAPNLGFYSMAIDHHEQFYAVPALPTHLPLARNKVIRKLIEKAELGIEANLAQDFAQLGQTIRLIDNTVNRIVGSARKLKRGNIAGAIDALTTGRRRTPSYGSPSVSRTLAENWLELQYGWKPLLYDVYGAMKSLSNLQLGNERFVQQVAASALARSTVRTTFPSSSSYITNLGSNRIETETRCKIVLRFRIASALKSFLAQTGFTNPVNLAWEILPFSFVADWFLPIGPWLETLSSWDGLEFLDGSQTQFTRQRVVSAIDGANIATQNNTLFREEHSTYRRTVVQLDRVRLNTFPMPTFPSFKNGLASVDHALNGIALLKSIFHH